MNNNVLIFLLMIVCILQQLIITSLMKKQSRVEKNQEIIREAINEIYNAGDGVLWEIEEE